jgi:protein-S-isoprenylcysteine O-methyltransferase Ste14
MKTMSKAIRVVLVVVALLCVPALVFPELGVSTSAASPVAIMLIAGLAAILWPSSKAKKVAVEAKLISRRGKEA